MLLRNSLRALLLVLIAGPLSAQAPARPLELPRDSAVFSALRQAVLPRMRRELATLRSNEVRLPLRFDIRAEGDTAVWRAFAREIADSLGTRPVTALDRHAGLLQVGHTGFRDSLFEGYVGIGTDFFCGTEYGAGLSGYSVRAVRDRDGRWSPLVLDNVMPNHGSCIASRVKPEEMPGAAARIAWIRERYPCPEVLPSQWTAFDKSLGKGFPCSLVSFASEVLGTTNQAIENSARDVGCVELITLATIGWQSHERGPGTWEVVYYGRNTPGVKVWIDAVSGEATVFPVHFAAELRGKSPCRK